MRTLLTAGLLLGSGLVTAARAEITVETYTSRSAFEARLGNAVSVVDFDDVATSGDAPVSFASDRYVALGVLINGESGQYVSRTFGDPTNYPPASSPNMYAPGPIDTTIAGGNQTNVTFSTGDAAGAVAGFGAVFIDVDSDDPLNFFPSSLNALDPGGQPLAVVDVEGGSAEAVFRGLVTIDSTTGDPIPAIARVQILNGGGWPGATLNQGVPLDDFVFPAPIVATTTTTVSTSSTTSTTLVACPPAPAEGCRQTDAVNASRLMIADGANDTSDAINWTWTHGTATAEEFSAYAAGNVLLCLYDADGIRLEAVVPGAGTCGRRPCWKSSSKRVLYRDPTQSRDGIVQILLRAATEGKSQITWLGQGAKLQPPALPLATPVVAQTIIGGRCFEAVFTTPKKNAAGRFRGVAD